jgi:UDP-N-acetylglucosamine 3-dehydrogenase
MLNVAVIGCGAMGKNHVRVYSEIQNTNLVAVADPNQENVDLMAKKFNINKYLDYKEMIKNEKIDIVSIVAPTIFHKEISLYCMENKINVLLEKPITDKVQNGLDVITAAKKNNVKLMIGHIERFNPAIIELKKRLDAKELGKVFKIDVNRVGPFPARIRDVGVVIDLAVHDIDIMRYLLGSEVKRLYAETRQEIHTQCEDILNAMLKFDNETICNLNINWVTPTKIRKLYITGEKGMFIVDYLSQDLYFYENKDLINGENYNYLVKGVSEGNMVKYAINRKEPLRAELEHFVTCVEDDEKPLVSGKDGLKALEIAINIIKSANENIIIK